MIARFRIGEGFKSLRNSKSMCTLVSKDKIDYVLDMFFAKGVHWGYVNPSNVSYDTFKGEVMRNIGPTLDTDGVVALYINLGYAHKESKHGGWSNADYFK